MVTDAEVYQYAVRKDVDVLDMNKTMAYTVESVEFRAAKTSVI